MNLDTQNFIAIDLELNNGKTDDPSLISRPKLIQVGVAIGNISQTPKEYHIQKWYIDPEEPIYPFITKLTGITDADIQHHADSPETIAAELGSLIKQFECFVNPVTWGGNDSQELKNFFIEHNIYFPFFGWRVIDTKTIYTFQQLSKKGSINKTSLRSALSEFKLKFIGTPHRADNDAASTLSLYFAMIHRQRAIEQLLKQSKGII